MISNGALRIYFEIGDPNCNQTKCYQIIFDLIWKSRQRIIFSEIFSHLCIFSQFFELSIGVRRRSWVNILHAVLGFLKILILAIFEKKLLNLGWILFKNHEGMEILLQRTWKKWIFEGRFAPTKFLSCWISPKKLIIPPPPAWAFGRIFTHGEN